MPCVFPYLVRRSLLFLAAESPGKIAWWLQERFSWSACLSDGGADGLVNGPWWNVELTDILLTICSRLNAGDLMLLNHDTWILMDVWIVCAGQYGV